MDRSQVIKLIFSLVQLLIFGTIFGLQFYYGTGISYINEWMKASWCLAFGVYIALTVPIAKLREWAPWTESGWKLAIGVAVMSCFGFRSTLSDIRTILAIALCGASVAVLMVFLALPETRPKATNDRIDLTNLTFKSPTEEEIQTFNKNRTKYQPIGELEDSPQVPSSSPHHYPNLDSQKGSDQPEIVYSGIPDLERHSIGPDVPQSRANNGFQQNASQQQDPRYPNGIGQQSGLGRQADPGLQDQRRSLGGQGRQEGSGFGNGGNGYSGVNY